MGLSKEDVFAAKLSNKVYIKEEQLTLDLINELISLDFIVYAYYHTVKGFRYMRAEPALTLVIDGFEFRLPKVHTATAEHFFEQVRVAFICEIITIETTLDE